MAPFVEQPSFSCLASYAGWNGNRRKLWKFTLIWDRLFGTDVTQESIPLDGNATEQALQNDPLSLQMLRSRT